MAVLVRLLKRARRSFAGSLPLRLVVVVAMAVLTGASAGVLPAVLGEAVGAVAGAGVEGAPPGAFARLVAVWMPADAPGLVLLVALVATVLTVGLGVASSQRSTQLSGDVTAALRIEMMATVLAASARDVADAGTAIAAPRRPPGMGPPGKVAPARRAPPGKAPAGGAGLASKTPPGAGDGATRAAVVKLAVSREASLVADFGVSVMTGLPQSIATIAVLGVELVSTGAWVVLAGGTLLFVSSRLLADRASRRVGERRRELQNADAAVFGNLQATLAATEDIRLWGGRAQAVAEFAAVAEACAASRARFATALAVSGQIKSVFTAMAPLLILVALQWSGRSYGPGDVAKLLLLVPLLMVRLEALDGIRQGLIERGPVLEATDALLGLAPAPPRHPQAVAVDPARVEGQIRFEGVGFTPPGAAHPILEGVALTIPAGAVVGVCGPSGSGKSTLVRLLLRLDDPTEGRVVLDGTDLGRIEPAQLPALFGVVRQTSRLFERSVRDNLAYGLDEAPSDAAMRDALVAVHLDELASPAGDRDLDTVVSASPPNFSGGEQRRLLIARMLLQSAPVAVLDEPEAGLPAGTAEAILGTIRQLAEGRTHVVVTHAPHLLQSDFNVVLDGGRVVGVGTHEELEATCEPYRRLLAAQP